MFIRCGIRVALVLMATLVIAGRTLEPQDANRLTAESLTKEAEELRKAGNGESLRKAIDKLAESLPFWQTLGDRTGEAAALFQISAIYRLLGDNSRAAEFLDKTLPLKRELGDNEGVVDTLGLIGDIASSAGDTEKAIRTYEESLSLAQKIAYRRGEGRTLSRLGLLLTSIGDYPKAIDVQTQALKIAQAEGDRLGEAAIFLNTGLAKRLSGETQAALENYRQALTSFQELADRPQDPQKLNNIHVGEAQAMENIGVLYSVLGDEEAALQWFDKALSLYRNGGNRQQEARMLSNMGGVYLASNDYAKASDLFKQALTLARAAGDRAVQGGTLESLADLSGRMGNGKEALEYATQALNTLQAASDARGQASAYLRIGSIHYNLREPTKAHDAYNQALLLTRTLKYPGGEAQALAGLAHIDHDNGSLELARQQMETALTLIESMRSSVAIHDLRTSYFASTQDNYEFYISLLMQLHREHPADGFDALALQAAERSRARSLLELLAEGHADVRRGVDPALLEQERSRQQRLDATALRYAGWLDDPNGKTQAAAVLTDIESQSRELAELEAQIRLKSPRYAALMQPHTVALREIQQDILDPETALLEYQLGKERSYLWLVTKTSLTTHELPPRAAIEEAAHRVYEQLTARQPKPGKPALSRARLAEQDDQYSSDAAALSMTLLGPVRQELGTRRLIIVADGVLQYLPFSALPEPEAGNAGQPRRPLTAEHEIVSMPSASTLGLLRQDLATRAPAKKAMLIFADPVFDTNDSRVRTSLSRTAPHTDEPILTGDLRRAARSADLTDSHGSLPRLIFSRREAAGIVSAGPAGEVVQALDFDANRQTALSPQLSEYRIIHFATHAILNSEYPELSGIILSLVDRDGTTRDGFLRLHDLYNLNLPAELVVLSACQTGLGKDIKGEGLIGLTRGFMYAGAARVIASLWEVDDAATAELMKEFYGGMFGSRHLPPAAALRAAQQTISRQKQWAAPYYWAGFVLQGDWKGWQEQN